MTHDLLLDERQRLSHLEWLRFSAALLMVLTMIADGVAVLIFRAPALLSLAVYLIVLTGEATLLFWTNRKVSAQLRVYTGMLQQAYEEALGRP